MKQPHSSTEALYALIFAACVLLALFLLTACSKAEAPAAESRPAVKGDSVVFNPQSPAAQRLAVERAQPPVDREVVIPGRLTWNEERTVRVFTPFAGRVTRLIANVGDTVKPGQPLAEMASPDFAQAQADARKARSEAELAKKALGRQRELHAHGVIALKDLQQAEADETRTRIEAERASNRLASYGQAADASGGFVLRSPMAGTIVERNLNPGQELRPDQPGAPLFVVTDPTRLWITLDATEADLRSLKRGMLLVVTSNQFVDETFAGELRQIADFVDPVTRSVKLRGDLPNPERKLKGEMFVAARVRLEKDPYATVNAKAIFLDGVRRFAFVREAPGTFTRRAVRVGPEVDGRVPVYAGLKEGDEVVVAGNLFLQQILGAVPVAQQ
jgi:cobalt-zinc-cadmium efflux system membrane fusion protein